MDDRWRWWLAWQSALQILGNDEWRPDEERQSAAHSIGHRWKIFLRKSQAPVTEQAIKWREEISLFSKEDKPISILIPRSPNIFTKIIISLLFNEASFKKILRNTTCSFDHFPDILIATWSLMMVMRPPPSRSSLSTRPSRVLPRIKLCNIGLFFAFYFAN